MFKITFLNVGQGDCILLEWTTDVGIKIGIIDSKISYLKPIKNPNVIDLNKNGNNQNKSALVSHIKQNFPELKFIEFVLVSHPHSDHYSGMEDLLNYCLDNKIEINFFLHTWQRIIQYLYLRNSDTKLTNELKIFNATNPSLTSLFQLINKLTIDKINGAKKEPGTVKIINNLQNIDTHRAINLSNNSNIFISIICPHGKVYEDFSQDTNVWNEKVDNDDSKLYNSLSTVLEIVLETENGKEKIWLTSDVESDILSHYFNEDENEYYSILIQVPHHGSIKNHYEKIYNSINSQRKKAVLSTSYHRGYDHPSDVVVKFLYENNFEIFSTNYLHPVFNEIGKLKVNENDAKGNVVFEYKLKK